MTYPTAKELADVVARIEVAHERIAALEAERDALRERPPFRAVRTCRTCGKRILAKASHTPRWLAPKQD